MAGPGTTQTKKKKKICWVEIDPTFVEPRSAPPFFGLSLTQLAGPT